MLQANESLNRRLQEARILIVDDEPANVELLADVLQVSGYAHIRSVTDARKAVSTYQEMAPDLVLLDLRMPYLDGVQVMERLQARMEGVYVPIVVLTAAQDRETRLRVLRAGANDFLTKPFDVAEVQMRIRNQLEVRFLSQETAEGKQRLESILESVDDAIAMFDVRGTLLFANDAHAKLFGLEGATIPTSAEELRERIQVCFQEPAAFAASEAALFAHPEMELEEIIEVRTPVPKMLYRITRPVRDAERRAVKGRIVVYRDVSKELEVAEMKAEVLRLRTELEREHSFGNILGKSSNIRDMFTLMQQASESDVTVLIQGESGTGKELVARAIHSHSPRHRSAFIPVNCAAIPEGLIESELFGHERGAFTGANMRRVGKFELAHRGTIFLDEIGDMPFSLQAKLLRVIQEREIQRVGGTATIPIDVRILAATNKDLQNAVQAGDFREDLYYRLAVFPISIPPLRERPGDVPILAEHFLKKYAEEFGKQVISLSSQVLRTLMEYNWPGNVRELENVIQRALLLESSGVLRMESLPAHLHETTQVASETLSTASEVISLDEAEKEALLRTIRVIGPDPQRCADALGIHRATFYRKLSKHGLQLES
jgi:DNA-binding NtrC family response regulator